MGEFEIMDLEGHTTMLDDAQVALLAASIKWANVRGLTPVKSITNDADKMLEWLSETRLASSGE